MLIVYGTYKHAVAFTLTWPRFGSDASEGDGRGAAARDRRPVSGAVAVRGRHERGRRERGRRERGRRAAAAAARAGHAGPGAGV